MVIFIGGQYAVECADADAQVVEEQLKQDSWEMLDDFHPADTLHDLSEEKGITYRLYIAKTIWKEFNLC